MLKKILILSGICVIISLAAYALLIKKEEPKIIEVNFGIVKNPWSAPLVIADKKGFLINNGIKANITVFNLGKEALDSVLRKQIDIVTVADLPVAYLGFQKNQHVKIIANITRSSDVVLLARQDSGISSPNDIYNKKISSFKGTIAEFALHAFLKENNLDEKKISFQYLDPTTVIPSLVRGDIDGAILWEPLTSKAEKALGGKFTKFEIKNYKGTFNLLAGDDYLKNNPQAVNKVLKSIYQAVSYIKSNPVESQRIIAQFSSVDGQVISSVWNKFNFRIGLDNTLFDLLKQEGQWVSGQTGKKLPDYKNYIDDKYINSFNNQN